MKMTMDDGGGSKTFQNAHRDHSSCRWQKKGEHEEEEEA